MVVERLYKSLGPEKRKLDWTFLTFSRKVFWVEKNQNLQLLFNLLFSATSEEFLEKGFFSFFLRKSADKPVWPVFDGTKRSASFDFRRFLLITGCAKDLFFFFLVGEKCPRVRETAAGAEERKGGKRNRFIFARATSTSTPMTFVRSSFWSDISVSWQGWLDPNRPIEKKRVVVTPWKVD